MSDYPTTAVRVRFQPAGMAAHVYRIWEGAGGWYWQSLGNGGHQPSQELAMEEARRWIKDNGRGTKRFGSSRATKATQTLNEEI